MTTSSARAPQPWEVWLAYVRFADHPDVGKVRSVVILDNEIAAVVVAKVTTAQPQPMFEYCELEDWKEEGLLKPSRVQTTPLFRVAPTDLLNAEPLGTLSPGDRRHLNRALRAQR
ncbi:MAG: type II toxin-antitoxin system PemK/MazF family toxin [Eggerthellaceae bacterium]|nr:type II toxin-antitoxin system PemK/MazF family toxin [Eggerthellaceae bacterium]